jgi:hypothetical protein
MNRTLFVRSLQSAIGRCFAAAALLVSLICPAVYAQISLPSGTSLGLSQPGTVAAGTVETLTATITSWIPNTLGGGFVTFYDGKRVLGIGQVIGAAHSPVGPQFSAVLKTRLGIGTHSLTATYSGRTGLAGSRSGAQVLTVSGSYPLSLGLTASSASPYNFTATATASGTPAGLQGPVSFSDASDATLQLGTASLASPLAQAGLAPTGNVAAGLGTGAQIAVATGDFNGDGIPDLAAVASQGDTSIAIMLGNGDGTFKAPSYVPIGINLLNVAVGDFNADGILDLVATGQGNESVIVIPGNGDGTFNTNSQYGAPINGTVWGVAIGDFDGDGILDIAATDSASNTVKFLVGQGNGTFALSSYDVVVGASPDAIAVGDLNNDGILDLVVADYGDGTAIELLGNGDGTFSATTLPIGQYPEGVVIADFNGDGRPDIATANSKGAGLTVLLQQPNGSFAAQGSYASFSGTSALVAGDFNSDGILDLAMASDTPGYIFVLLGDGKGNFQQPAISLSMDAHSSGLVAADFNGDGITDLASGTNSGLVAVLDGYVTTTTTASIKAAVPGMGTHSVVALYSGSANFPPALSNSVKVGAAIEQTALTLTAPSTAQPGQPFTLIAQLSPFTVKTSNDEALSTDGETITFLSGTTVLGTGTLAGGVASRNVTLPAGNATITAKFAGDSIFTASTSNASSVNVGSTSDALSSLKGQYAFLIHAALPYAANTPIDAAVVASFYADGAGHISAGTEDSNGGTGVSVGLTFTGTYTLASNGTGTATITNSNGQSQTMGFLVSGTATNGTVAAANIVLLGGTTNGSGLLLQQTPADFALAGVQGSYAFGLTGETCYTSCTTKTTNTGAVSANWRVVLNNSTTVSATATEQVGITPYQGLTLNGTATAPSSANGRMTLTMGTVSTPANQPTHFVVYVVDAVHLLLLSTDSHSTTMLLSGEGQYQ